MNDSGLYPQDKSPTNGKYVFPTSPREKQPQIQFDDTLERENGPGHGLVSPAPRAPAGVDAGPVGLGGVKDKVDNNNIGSDLGS